MQRVPPELTANARALRSNATPAERLLWRYLREYQPRFTRQLIVDRYILDLACRSARVAVELDGGHHADQQVRDETRTAYLEACGWTVLRFWNGDVTSNVGGVVATILDAVARSSTHPQPLPFREGSSYG